VKEAQLGDLMAAGAAHRIQPVSPRIPILLRKKVFEVFGVLILQMRERGLNFFTA